MNLKFPLVLLKTILAIPLFAVTLASFAEKPVYTASFEYFNHQAELGKPMSVVFFGGSLIAGEGASDPARTSYRALLENYLQEKYPKARFDFYDASRIGTGSSMGMFRLDSDVLSHKPDLVVVDFTIEDGMEGTDRQTLASFELILRDLISQGVPVLEILAGTADHFGADWKHLGPIRMRDYLEMGNLYHTAIGNSFPAIQDFLHNDLHKREEIWPEGKTFVNDVGHHLIFESARDSLEKAIAEKKLCRLPPAPVFAEEYTKRFQFFPASSVIPTGWHVETSGVSSHEMVVGEAKEEESIAPIQLNFTGTFVGILGESDANGFGFTVSVDGKPVLFGTEEEEVWPTTNQETDNRGKFFWHTISDNLTPERHTIQIRPATDFGVGTSSLRVISICFAGPPEDSAQAIAAKARND